MNGYPAETLDKIMKERRHNRVDQVPEANQENREKILCIPYVRGLSEKIDKVCKSLNRVTVKTVFKPMRTLRQALVKVKNKIPAEMKKGVIMSS